MHSINPQVKRALKGEMGRAEEASRGKVSLSGKEGSLQWLGASSVINFAFCDSLSNWKPDIGKCLEMLMPQ